MERAHVLSALKDEAAALGRSGCASQHAGSQHASPGSQIRRLSTEGRGVGQSHHAVGAAESLADSDAWQLARGMLATTPLDRPTLPEIEQRAMGYARMLE